jgi:hypothetical protein
MTIHYSTPLIFIFFSMAGQPIQYCTVLGGNTSGDFKLKPMLIYHSMTPRAMKGYSKEYQPVIWKSNKKAWPDKRHLPAVVHKHQASRNEAFPQEMTADGTISECMHI